MALRKMYWCAGSAGKIQSADIDGSNVADVYTGIGRPKGLDLHPASGQIYWTDSINGNIHVGGIDGSGHAVLVSGGGVGMYQGIAVDDINDHFYVCTSLNGSERVTRFDLDGSNPIVVVSGVSMADPIDITLDVPNDRFYWTDYTRDHVAWSTLDGASSGVLIGGINRVTNLTIDTNNSRFYCTTLTEIWSFDTNGDGAAVIVSGIYFPGSISVESIGQKVYYSLRDDGTLNYCDFDGSNSCIITSGLTQPQWLTVDPIAANQCTLYLCGAAPGVVNEVASVGLFIAGAAPTPSGVPIRTIHRLTKTADYDPQLIGSFVTTPVSANIEVWDIVDGQNTAVVIANSGCYAIGDTGKFGWSLEHLPFTNEHKKYHYYYRMTSNEGEYAHGEFFVTVPERGRWSHPD